MYATTTYEPGDRVARWHFAFAEQADPVPGTVLRVGKRYLTVAFDRLTADDTVRVRRVEPRNVTPWSEPPDYP